MKARLVVLGVAATLICFGLHANAQDGTNAAILQKALVAVAKGSCPADLMSPLLRGTCEQQMPNMGQVIAQKGAITKAEFMGTQQTAMGPAEVYRVHFANGPMMWMINTGPDGKIVVLWTPG